MFSKKKRKAIPTLEQTISKRAFILGTGKVILTGALISRMSFLQLWQSSHYKTLSEGNRIKLRLLAPRRGLLFDRNGKILAKNIKTFHVFIIPRQINQPEELLVKLKTSLSIEDDVFETILEKFKKAPRHLPFVVKDHLTWEEVSKLEIARATLPGISIEDGIERSYPDAEHISHVLGYIQPVKPEDTNDRNLLKIPNFKLGKTGFEKALDQELQGKVGYQEEEVDAYNKVIRKLSVNPAIPGKDFKLTIDQRLQAYVHHRISENHSASAVVMNVHNGHLLCLNSTPGFDPNIFSKPIPHALWHELTTNEHKPLVNKAIQGEYSPGSIFKLVVALAALEEGVITPQTQVHCPGYRQIGNRRFHCWKSSGHGMLDLDQAIQKSCDVYYYDISLKIGIEKIAHYARLLGFDKLTNVEIAGERRGLVPDKNWKNKTLGRSWTIGETANIGIGQGYLLATPIQLALSMARMVNGGKEIYPTLLKEAPVPDFRDLPVSRKNLDFLVKAMSNTVNLPTGTGFRSRITEERFRYGGKTSTTQVRRITAEERRLGLHRKERPWKWRDHALFSGFAPVHSPKYAVSVVVEHGGWGSAVAGPIIQDLILKVQQLES